MTKKKRLFLILLAVVTPVIIYFLVWLISTDVQIREKFTKNSFLAPTQFYSNALNLQLGQILQEDILIQLLERNNYRKKEWGAVLQASDYAVARGGSCEQIYSASVKCFAFHHHERKKIHIVAADETDRVVVLLEVDAVTRDSRSVESLPTFPQLFAQYLGTSPVIQENLPLSQIPRQCLDAAMAIEDPTFLDHQGISLRGLLRSQIMNLLNLRITSKGLTIVNPQGGSTITQQLVKNYFLTSDRRVSRKIKEMLMAMIVEARIPKDQILETYLNIIYLGQQGNFQVRGYAAASRFYFKRDLQSLDLAECALLGAVINSPGLFNPFKHQERAIQRREKVLRAMLEQNRILPEDFEIAAKAPLPVKAAIEVRETAPYFIEAVTKQLAREGYLDLSGLKIYTTLNLLAQSAAQKAVQSQLAQLESSSDYHQKNKAHSLQATLVASDPKTGEVVALVGGRDHRQTPYNRVLESRRQVGSIFKPLVYLAAFHEKGDFSPLSMIENSPFEHKTKRNVWKPRNYDNSFSQPVPAYYALKESLNVPTARLALDVGLGEIIDLARDVGIESSLKEFPALSLGAFEATAFEMLQVYTTFARFGSRVPLKMIRRVENLEGYEMYTPETVAGEQVLTPGEFANVNSILEETMLSGTGQSARARGLTSESAGKTGTTSDYRDAWFAGFLANHVAVVWTGYDDNTPIKLSGASGALPIWTDYMTSMSRMIGPEPFPWPAENQTTIDVSLEQLLEMGIPADKAKPAQLLFYPKD